MCAIAAAGSATKRRPLGLAERVCSRRRRAASFARRRFHRLPQVSFSLARKAPSGQSIFHRRTESAWLRRRRAQQARDQIRLPSRLPGGERRLLVGVSLITPELIGRARKERGHRIDLARRIFPLRFAVFVLFGSGSFAVISLSRPSATRPPPTVPRGECRRPATNRRAARPALIRAGQHPSDANVDD